jgi:hypothetical protein
MEVGEIRDSGGLELEVLAVEGEWALCYGDNSCGEYSGGEVIVPVRFLETLRISSARGVLSDEQRRVALADLRALLPA